jgi:hypothetical protein
MFLNQSMLIREAANQKLSLGVGCVVEVDRDHFLGHLFRGRFCCVHSGFHLKASLKDVPGVGHYISPSCLESRKVGQQLAGQAPMQAEDGSPIHMVPSIVSNRLEFSCRKV